LIWKIYGQRLDGWTNDDFPTASVPGDANTLELAGELIPNTQSNRDRSDLDFRGSVMPPPKAVESGKVQPLTDADRRTLVRWIDLGCPIDYDFDSTNPDRRGFGWACDDKRPTLTLTNPQRKVSARLSKITIGMHDYYSGLDLDSFTVKADFDVDGVSAGENLATKFESVNPGVFEYRLKQPLTSLANGSISIAIKDRQGNISELQRTISITADQTR